MSGHVGYLQGQNHNECRIVGSGQEVADVAAYSLVEGDETKAKGAGDVGAEKYQDEKASFVDEFVVQVDTGQDGQGDEGAVGTCISVVTSVLKLNRLMMMVPKLEMPPFGMLPVHVLTTRISALAHASFLQHSDCASKWTNANANASVAPRVIFLTLYLTQSRASYSMCHQNWTMRWRQC